MDLEKAVQYALDGNAILFLGQDFLQEEKIALEKK